MARSSTGGARRGGGSSSGSRSSGGSSGRISGGRSRSTGGVNRNSSGFSRSGSGSHSSSSGSRPFGGASHGSGPQPHPHRSMPHPPPRHNHHRPAPPRRSTTYYNTGGHYRTGRTTYRRGSCLSYVIALLIVFGILIVAAFISNRNSSKIPNSNQHTGQQVTQNNNSNTGITVDVSDASKYYSDQAGWISNKATLLSGLKTFEDKTGVSPFLYIADTINGSTDPTDDEMDTFTGELYDQLFTDENHFLLVFFANDDYYITWYVCGNDAANTLTTSDTDKVLDYIDKYYQDTSISNEELFSKAFRSAADDIAK